MSGVNYSVNSKYISISHNYAAEFLRFGIFGPQISESCGATYRRNCNMFSALQNTSGPLTNRKQRPNRCIIGDAILPQTGTKLTKNAVLNLALCCGAIWRAIEKNRNIGAQLNSILYTTAQKRFGKICFLYDFWCAQIPSRFWTTIRNLTVLLSALCSDVRKIFYIGAHLQSRP